MINLKSLAYLVVFGLTCWLHAEELRGQIDRIDVVSKNSVAVREDLVRSLLKLKEGSRFSSRELSEEIKRLFESGHFADIQVEVLEKEPGKFTVVYKILAKVRVRDIIIHGADEISESSLRKKLTQAKRETLQEEKIAADLDAINKEYQEDGHWGTQVRCYLIDSSALFELAESYLKPKGQLASTENIQSLFSDRSFFHKFTKLSNELFYEDSSSEQVTKGPCPSGEVHVIYWINERQRFLVRDVELEGATATTLKEIRKKQLIITEYALFSGYVSNAILEDDAEQIRRWYWDHGYFDAQVTDIRKVFGKTAILRRQKVDVQFAVSEGKPYKINAVTIKGNSRFDTDMLKSLLHTRPGEVYEKTKRDRSLKAIEGRYFKLGYLDFRIKSELTPSASTKTVDVTYTITEGKPSRIRNIFITNNTITKDNVIRRELSILPGDLGNKNKIRSSQRRLRGLGYFKRVDILTIDTEDPEVKDLRVMVVENDTGSLSTSVAFSDSESVGLRFEFGQSNFDLFGWNRGFRGGGQRFKIAASIGDRQNSYTLSFAEPWLFNRRLRYDLDIWRRYTGIYGSYDQRNTGEQMRLTKEMPWKYWKGYLGHRWDQVIISDVDDDFSSDFLLNEDGNWQVSTFLTGVIRDSRDRFVFPTRGSRLSLGLEYQKEEIGGYTDLYRFDFSYNYYLPIFKSAVFKFGSRAGHISKLGGDEGIKVFDRYFSGGTGSIRGFDTRDVGPIDPSNGEAVGGKSIITMSTELLQPFHEEILYGALFVDSGNVWEGTWDWTIDELNVGAGLGIRIRLPIGAAISLDYGWPLHIIQTHIKDRGRFHFTLGYRF